MELYHCLIKYFLDIIDSNNDNLKQRANYVAIRLMNTFGCKMRYSPSLSEMIYIEKMKPIPVEINFFSGATTTMQVESYTTLRNLKTEVMKKLQLNMIRIPFFALYEICYKQTCFEERYLSDIFKVCEVLSVWDNNIEDFTQEREKITFKIFLKIIALFAL